MSEERIHVRLVLDGREYETGLNRAGQATKSFSDTIQGVAEKLTLFATTTLALVGTQGIKTAMDLEESMNKVEVAFGSASKSIIDFSKTTTDTLGISQGAALDMAGTFGDMATGMGITQEQAAEMSKRLVQLAGDLASFKNIGIEQAQTALNSVFTGETESLKLLGVVMTEANLQAFALANGISKKVQQMTEAEKVSLRYAFVIDKTKNAHGDYARTADGATNATRTMQERFKEVTGEIMATLLPAYTRLVQGINEILKATSQLSPQMKTLVAVIGGIVAIAGPVTLAVMGISSAFTTLSAAIYATPIAGWVAGAVTAIVALAIAVTAYWDDIQKIFINAQIGYKNFIIGLLSPLEKMGFALGDVARGAVATLRQEVQTLNNEIFKINIKDSKGGSFMAQELGYTELGRTQDSALPAITGGTTKFTPPSDAGTMQFGKKFTEGIKKLQQQVENAHAEFILFWERLPDKKINGLSLNGIFQTQLFAGGKIELGITEETLKDFDISGDKIAKKFEELTKKAQEGIKNFKANTIGPAAQAARDLAEAVETSINAAFEDLALLGLESFGSVIEGLVTNALGGNFDWKKMGAQLLNGVASIMEQLGKQLIIVSGALEAFRVSIATINPPVALAAGIALIAAAGAVRGFGNSIANKSTASNVNQSGFTAPSFNVQGAFTLKGTDLVASINNTKTQFGI